MHEPAADAREIRAMQRIPACTFGIPNPAVVVVNDASGLVRDAIFIA